MDDTLTTGFRVSYLDLHIPGQVMTFPLYAS